MNLEAVAEYLATQNVGVIGKTLFVHNMPSTASGVLLLESLTGTTIDHELPGYKKTSFQVIVRNSAYAASKQQAESIMDKLNLKGFEIGANYFHYIRPRHEPIVYPRSDGDYLETSVNYDACYYHK